MHSWSFLKNIHLLKEKSPKAEQASNEPKMVSTIDPMSLNYSILTVALQKRHFVKCNEAIKQKVNSVLRVFHRKSSAVSAEKSAVSSELQHVAVPATVAPAALDQADSAPAAASTCLLKDESSCAITAPTEKAGNSSYQYAASLVSTSEPTTATDSTFGFMLTRTSAHTAATTYESLSPLSSCDETKLAETISYPSQLLPELLVSDHWADELLAARDTVASVQLCPGEPERALTPREAPVCLRLASLSASENWFTDCIHALERSAASYRARRRTRRKTQTVYAVYEEPSSDSCPAPPSTPVDPNHVPASQDPVTSSAATSPLDLTADSPSATDEPATTARAHKPAPYYSSLGEWYAANPERPRRPIDIARAELLTSMATTPALTPESTPATTPTAAVEDDVAEVLSPKTLLRDMAKTIGAVKGAVSDVLSPTTARVGVLLNDYTRWAISAVEARVSE
ncbi:hypothetical protein BZA70DRAFT_110746 [Myxozyma melibiosi]|uniref:Uncharacterized protein n=1 Tax=Myxozyma melibiosi TaxID=54550 RepID=A0ABR1FA57_9ASCO